MKALDRFYSQFSYNGWYSLEKSLYYFGVGCVVTSHMPALPADLSTPVGMAGTTALFANIVMYFSNGANHTKSIVEIKELYNEFIKRYNKLNKEFDFNNPVQVFTMYTYLLNKGYFSKDKSFEFSKANARDIEPIMGANVMTGTAVCRHTSVMLADVLNDYGINAGQIGAYTRDFVININTHVEDGWTKEECMNWIRKHIVDDDVYAKLTMAINILYDQMHTSVTLEAKKSEEKNVLKRVFGNHAITFAYDDKNDYFFDPTNDRIYRAKEDGNLADYDTELSTRGIASILLSSGKSHFIMKQRMKNGSTSIPQEEEEKMIIETKTLCENNMDVFDQFYGENKELIEDVGTRVLSLKKKGYFKIH